MPKVDIQPKLGALRVWWIPQVPMKGFRVPVKNIGEAKLILNTLADYDIFQFKNNIKPDYCNAGGLEVYVSNIDGDHTPGWEEWEDKEGNDIDNTEEK